MGAAFHRAVHGSARPTVGLLNVGTEDEKGHEEVREAHRLLREMALDFDYRGFVEGDDIAKGTVDVVVTDGFTGNVALKTAEGLARYLPRRAARRRFTSSLLAQARRLDRIGGACGAWRERFDPSTINGGAFPGTERDCGQKPWRRRRARLRHRHPPGGRPGRQRLRRPDRPQPEDHDRRDAAQPTRADG